MEGIFKNKKSEKIRYMDGVPQVLTGGFLSIAGLLFYLLILDTLYPSDLNEKLSIISLFLLIIFSVLFFFYYEKIKKFIREKFIYNKTGYFAPLPLPKGIKIFFFLSLISFLLFIIFGVNVNKDYFNILIFLPHILVLLGILVFFLYSFSFDFLFSFIFSLPVFFLKIHSDIMLVLILLISGFVLLISGVVRWMNLKKG